MLLPLLVLNLGAGTGDLDFTVVEIVRDYRLENAAIVIDGALAGYTSAIGVFREASVTAGSHTVMIVLDGYNTFSGTFNVTTGFTTVGEFHLIPFVNRFLLKAPPLDQPYSLNPDISRYGHYDCDC